MIKISWKVYIDHTEAVEAKTILHNKIEMKMETTMEQTIAVGYTEETVKVSLLKRFMNWCKEQDYNRMLWVGIALTAHGCIITPITAMFVYLGGNNMLLFTLVIAMMGATLVTNLAAMPTKITLPVFISSVLIDLVIIISCLFMM